MSEPRSVLLDINDGVAELTLNQPERRNALDPVMRAQYRWRRGLSGPMVSMKAR